MEGSLVVKDPNQKVYRCNGSDYIPVQFKDITNGDTIKLDLTQNSIYIVESDYYNDRIDVQKVQ